MASGSIQANLPTNIIYSIIELHSFLHSGDLYFDNPLNYPPHITIVSGLDNNKINSYRTQLANKKLIVEKVQPGTYVDHERNLGVLWLEVQSRDLIEFNNELVNYFNLIRKNPYLPHISCAFIKPDSLNKYEDRLHLLGAQINRFNISSYSYLSEDGSLIQYS
jgi:hypothetical protein